MEKKRRINFSYVELVRFDISNLGDCDKLDFNYIVLKQNEMKNDTSLKIEKLKVELESKLKKIEAQKASLIMTATSFGWLGILAIIMLVLFVTFSDFTRFIIFLIMIHISTLNYLFK